MSNVILPSSSSHLVPLMLTLPRELRDLIYFYIVVEDDLPLDVTATELQAPLHHSGISAEWLEAIYTHRICSVTFSDPGMIRTKMVPHNIWGTHPQHKRFIRRLIVNVTESPLLFPNDHEHIERMCTIEKPEVRQEWTELLVLPRLESLRINMQKQHGSVFNYANFNPILYQLREQRPRLDITFHISFDTLLGREWNNELALHAGRQPGWTPNDDDLYVPMGFANVTELIEPPTDKDREYVEAYLPECTDPGSRTIVGGLLDETSINRRLLAQHYVVKEPELLRVLMAKQYAVYKAARDRRERMGVATSEELQSS
jgi:hypothetical protein